MSNDRFVTRRNVLLGGSAAGVVGLVGYTILSSGGQNESSSSDTQTPSQSPTPTTTREDPITPSIREPDHPRKRWVTRIPGEGEFYSSMSDPVIDTDSVWTGLYDGTVVRLDQSTGDVTWQFTPSGENHFAGGPTVGDGSVFFGLDDSGDSVFAVDIESNETTWTASIGEAIKSRPVVSDGRVFVGNSDIRLVDDDPEFVGDVFSMRISTGEKKWSVDIEDGVWYAPTLRNDRLYVAGKELVALDPQSGDRLWSITLPSRVETSPVVTDDFVIVQTEEEIRAVDRESREVSWSDSVPYPQEAQPATTDDIVVAAIDNDLIRAYDLQTGTAEWEFDTNSFDIYASLHVDSNTVYVAADDKVFALSLSTGERKWTVPLSRAAAGLGSTNSLLFVPQMSSSLITAVEKE